MFTKSKQTKHKILSAIVAMALIVTGLQGVTFNVFAQDGAADPTYVYVQGMDTMQGEARVGEGTASYDRATRTLTLTNISMTINGGSVGIDTDGDITIMLVGTNKIVRGEGVTVPNCISAYRNNLTIKSSDDTSKIILDGHTAVLAKNIIIENATIIGTGRNAALYAEENLTIINSTVSATSRLAEDGAMCSAVYAKKKITVDANSTLTASSPGNHAAVKSVDYSITFGGREYRGYATSLEYKNGILNEYRPLTQLYIGAQLISLPGNGETQTGTGWALKNVDNVYTLALTDMTLTETRPSYGYYISTVGDLNITLSGTNVIGIDGGGHIPGNVQDIGIFVGGGHLSLNSENGGSLTIYTQTALDVPNGNINVENAVISASNGEERSMAFECAQGNINIKNSIVVTDVYDGLNAEDGSVNISNSTLDLTSKSTALRSRNGSINIDDSDVTAVSLRTAINTSDGRININNSAVTAQGDGTAIVAYTDQQIDDKTLIRLGSEQSYTTDPAGATLQNFQQTVDDTVLYATTFAAGSMENSAKKVVITASPLKTTKISGCLLDANGKPMANVVVSLFSNPIYTVTDNDGNYTLDQTPVGTHTLRVFKTVGDFKSFAADTKNGRTPTVKPLAVIANLKIESNADGKAVVSINGKAFDAAKMDLKFNADGTLSTNGTSLNNSPATGDNSLINANIMLAVLSLAVLVIGKKKRA